MTERHRDPESVRVTAPFQPAMRGDGSIDQDETLARAAELRASGVTDFQLRFSRTVSPLTLADQLDAIASVVREARP